MLIFYILLLVSIISFIIPSFIEDSWYLYVIGSLMLIFALSSLAAFRLNNNPEIINYNELKIEYNYVMSHDSIPFKIKSDLYKNCSEFNKELEDYNNYHNSIWIGLYYPEINKNIDVTKYFDITKIE